MENNAFRSMMILHISYYRIESVKLNYVVLYGGVLFIVFSHSLKPTSPLKEPFS